MYSLLFPPTRNAPAFTKKGVFLQYCFQWKQCFMCSRADTVSVINITLPVNLSLFWNHITVRLFFCHICFLFLLILMLQILYGVNWHSSPDINESTKIYVTVWNLDLSNLHLHWIMHLGLFSRAESCKNREYCICDHSKRLHVKMNRLSHQTTVPV